MKDSKASYVAKGGMLVALTILILYAGTIIKINTFFLLGLSCAVIPLCVLITDRKTAAAVCASSALLAFLLIPDKLICLYYALFFGPYGLIKLLIERLNNTAAEIILKLLYFNVTASVILLLYKQLFMGSINLEYPLALFIAAGNVVFFILDYALTVFANNIRSRRLK